MSVSANDLMADALVEIGVLHPGEAAKAYQLSTVYKRLLRMIESWSTENLMVVADTLESFVLVAGTGEYTWGTGGTFNSSRPLELKDGCFYRDGDTDYPVALKSLDVYRRIVDKSGSGSPDIIAYSPEFPLGKVFLHPVPSSAFTLYVQSSKPLSSFTDRTTAVTFEPGMERALMTNLAVEISSAFGKSVSPELSYLATTSKQLLMARNSTQVSVMQTPQFFDLMG